MKEGLIGVIVPVYKVEKYVSECIESILAQTYTNFRLILVDDGTPDNAGKICDEYAKKDPRITVIHQENAGVTRARARGVEEASDCEFITFVDGDDTLPANALKEYLETKNTIKEDVDIIVGYRTEIADNTERDVLNEIKTGLYLPAEYINAMLVDECSIGPWGRLIKRELFQAETFSIPREVVQYEDLFMNIVLACNATNIFVDNGIKAYRHVELSDTSQVHVNGYMKENGWFPLLNGIRELLKEKVFFDSVSENFSKFAYIRICGCMNFNKQRFRTCEELQIKTYNRMQKSILKANRSDICFTIYTIKRKIRTFLNKVFK